MRRQAPRRTGTPVVVSLVLHAMLGAGLLRVLLVPSSLHWELPQSPRPKVEKVSYVAMPERGAPPSPGRDGGDDRPVTKNRRPAPILVAPTAVSSTLPPAAAAPAPDAGGSGPRVGAGGPTAGIRPSFTDARVWAPPGPVVVPSAALTPAEQLDHTLKADIARHNDSLATYAHVPSKLERGDWTVGGPGGKWGVEPGKIRLGKFSLPSAVLALLPLNMQGGQNAAGGRDLVAERAMAAVRRDIEYQSRLALNEDELRIAAKRIRERVDRERREKAEKEKALQPKPQQVELQP
jgi:hypothetical protein